MKFTKFPAFVFFTLFFCLEPIAGAETGHLLVDTKIGSSEFKMVPSVKNSDQAFYTVMKQHDAHTYGVAVQTLDRTEGNGMTVIFVEAEDALTAEREARLAALAGKRAVDRPFTVRQARLAEHPAASVFIDLFRLGHQSKRCGFAQARPRQLPFARIAG